MAFLPKSRVSATGTSVKLVLFMVVPIRSFESESFEDAIRNAISIGGDSDTLAAITGAVAEAYYGIPDDLKETALSYLDERLLNITERFEDKYIG